MLSNYLNNLQIRYKLLLLLIFPIIVLILFASDGVNQKWHQYSEARTVRNLYEIALEFSDVIHALQQERGLSAGYLGSGGGKFQIELNWQRAEADRHIQDVLSFSIMDSTASSDRHVYLREGMPSLIEMLDRRHALRKSVDAGKGVAAFEGYSEIITNVINLVENIGMVTGDAMLFRSDQAYGTLLWLQDFLGRERAHVNRLLSSGQISSERISLVVINIAKQDYLLKRFLHVVATTQQKRRLESLLTAPSFVYMHEVRQALFSKVKKLDLIDQLQIISGYGGLIHQFKNYVIRGEESYKANFIRLHAKAQKCLEDYRSIPNITAAEVEDLSTIGATFQRYHLFLPVIEQMRKDGRRIDQIDQVIKIDDTSAVNAIARLRRGVPEIDAADWFSAATKSINLLKADSDETRRQSLTYIKQKTHETLVALISYALLAIAVPLFCLYLGAAITRRLAVGTMEIAQALKQVEDSADFSGHIQVHGNDEIAAMGHSFNSLIKERHAAENRLHLAFKVFDSTIDGILITDSERKIISINRAATAITGFTEEEMTGKEPQVLASNHHHDAPFFQAIWRAVSEKGAWQGDMWSQRKNGETYLQWQNISEVRDKQGRLVNYISVFSDISVLKESQDKLEHLAHHDPLTGLPNRLLLDQHLSLGLERASRQKQLMAVLFLDLDRFKNINDSLGHPAGDELLKRASERLKGVIRAEDLIARLGGDEFAIVLELPSDERAVAMVAQKCIDAFIRPFRIDGSDVYSSTSVGVSLFPNDGVTADELVKHADTAMYHAKEHGRNSFQFYSRQMTELAVKRLTLESRLRKAIENREFVLHYQPQVSLESGRIIGAEALIRWQHPTGELIKPGGFIPVAEDSGLIEFIDAWVLQEACTELARWQLEEILPIFMAVNISGFSIEHGLLVDMVKKALYKSQVDPACLELEITESYLMQHKEQAVKIINELRDIGVRFSIDDFGTGYSSLSYLKSLPIDKLKIDRSFVQDIQHNENDRAIATSIIALGQSMQMQVVAEGIETREQLEILTSLGCDAAQGFFYSQSVTGGRLVALLKDALKSS
ncbi:MAG: EAL domain-containing protein [Candidatus Polarisedimenticolaceae bacterium]|nr:EAL domain-containing protein [Candidatus Polarisedimenticolaceae bacterium]